jgi:hypothetical protein
MGPTRTVPLQSPAVEGLLPGHPAKNDTRDWSAR